MTIHVNIGEAEKRLSELVAAAVRGEEVVLSEDGEPQVRLVAVPLREKSVVDRDEIIARRRVALGMWKDKLPADFDAFPSMTDDELEERWQRKGYAPPA